MGVGGWSVRWGGVGRVRRGGGGSGLGGGKRGGMGLGGPTRRTPPVLVLDEATSALDTQTERAVQEALDRLAEGRTTIAIAPRLSTLRDPDHIIVLHAGAIVEVGLPAEMVAPGRR